MILLPPRSTRTDTLFPYTTLFRSMGGSWPARGDGDADRVRTLPADRVLSAGRSGGRGALQILRRGMGRVFERSEEHTSELQSLMRISYAVFCLKKTNKLREVQSYRI